MSAYIPRVTYKNGSVELLGNQNPYDKIDLSQLSVFEIVSRDQTHVAVKLNILPEQRLIWRLRKLHYGTSIVTAHIVGKQQTIDGTNKQGIIVFYENDGSMDFMERFSDNYSFFAPPQLLPNEKWI